MWHSASPCMCVTTLTRACSSNVSVNLLVSVETCSTIVVCVELTSTAEQ